MGNTVALRRAITLPFLTLYGLGTMVGGGFYALLGEVAGLAGLFTPLAFACSGLLALVSAVSFAELSARYPSSAGEARYVYEGFGRRSLSTTIGWLVILTGVVSAATLSVAMNRFLQDFVAVPDFLGIPVLVIGMGLVASWGIGQSVGVVGLITVVEVGGLIYVAWAAGASLGQLSERWPELLLPAGSSVWMGIFAASFLAFYAFVGFEDMVNIAEEVKDVERTLPRAILVTVVLTTFLYVIVSLIAVLTVGPTLLRNSNTPIAEILRSQGWYATTGLGIVSLLAGLNGALVQIIMASRVAYGLARRQQAPTWMGEIHPRTQTPLKATAAMTMVILVLAIFLPLATLARTTSSVILLIFATVNLALWRIKKTTPNPPQGCPCFPRILPLIGFAACVSALVFGVWNAGN